MVPKISVSVLIMVAMFVGMEAVEMKQEDKKAKYAGGKNPHKHHLDFLGLYIAHIETSIICTIKLPVCIVLSILMVILYRSLRPPIDFENLCQ